MCLAIQKLEIQWSQQRSPYVRTFVKTYNISGRYNKCLSWSREMKAMCDLTNHRLSILPLGNMYSPKGKVTGVGGLGMVLTLPFLREWHRNPILRTQNPIVSPRSASFPSAGSLAWLGAHGQHLLPGKGYTSHLHSHRQPGGGGLTLKLETGFQDDGACGSVSFLGLLPNLQIATFLLQPHWMENNNWRPFP